MTPKTHFCTKGHSFKASEVKTWMGKEPKCITTLIYKCPICEELHLNSQKGTAKLATQSNPPEYSWYNDDETGKPIKAKD